MKRLSNKNNLLVLWGSGSPNKSSKLFKYDTYYIWAKLLIDNGLLDSADLLIANAHKHSKYKKVELSKNIFLHYCPRLSDLRKFKECKILFVRGNYIEYREVIKQTKYQALFYYAADTRFWPTCLDKRSIDVFFVDEPKYKNEVKKELPSCQVEIFEKAIDNKIFYPQKRKKKYDVCFVANFVPWKNHNILCSALSKLDPKTKGVFVGNLLDNDIRMQTLLWKYGLDNIELPGSLSPVETAKAINQSKLCVFPQELDANPRALIESLACNVPVVVNSEISGGLHLVNSQTGVRTSLANFHKAIDRALAMEFQPYKHYKENLNNKKIVVDSFKKINKALSL